MQWWRPSIAIHDIYFHYPMNFRLFNYLVILFLLCEPLFSEEWVGKNSYLFPDTGPVAQEQTRLDIIGGCHILSIALSPGFEDLSVLSYMRLAKGASISCVYVSNGEELPDDWKVESFQETAIRRKKEAYHAMQLLEGEAYFLNIPSNQLWVSARNNDFSDVKQQLERSLSDIIEKTKPDLIILNKDYSFDSDTSPRISFVLSTVKRIIKKIHQTSKITPRIVIQKGKRSTISLSVKGRNTVRNKTYQDLSSEIERTYKSLQYQLPLWKNSFIRHYAIAYPTSSKRLKTIDEGLPHRSQRVSEIYQHVQETITHASADKEQELSDIIDNVDYFISKNTKDLNKREQRDIVELKKKLERYRCAILNVSVDYSVNYNILTPIQVFLLRINHSGKWIHSGKNFVMFPDAMKESWIINEKKGYFATIQSDTTIRIITPKNLRLTDPATRDGFNAEQLSIPFTMMVVHNDPVKKHNFIFEKEIPIVVTQRQILEVLTPQIAAGRDTIVLVKITNNTHDKVKTAILIRDSIVTAPQINVTLGEKGEHIIDTLNVQWNPDTSFVNHTAFIKTDRGIPVAGVFCKNIGVNTANPPMVGIVDSSRASAIVDGLNRLAVPVIRLHPSHEKENISDSISTIVVSGHSSSLISSPSFSKILQKWIQAGGRIILFPQMQKFNFPDDSVMFSSLHTTTQLSDIVLTNGHPIISYPNSIHIDDLKQWLFAFSRVDLMFNENIHPTVIVKSKKTNHPLLVIRPYGKGEIIYCSLNMNTQLENLQTVAYKLLANMIAR